MHLNPEIAVLLTALNNPSLPGIDLSLTRIRKLLGALASPEKKIAPVIHIAGTNGKGSTLAFLRAMYEASGYRVHAYTSPHLVRFNERIVIAGSEISDDYLLALLQRVTRAAQTIPVTFFEATTALAFLAFADHHADVVLLETGLGGRLDATNIVANPLATIITPIDYDHMEFLGDRLDKIAAEKAGIIKHRVPCFVGAQQTEVREVLKRVARMNEAPLYLNHQDWRYDVNGASIDVTSGTAAWRLPLPALIGVHQQHNAALASVVGKSLPQLPVSDAALSKAMQQVRWPARLQKLEHGPLVEAWGARGEVWLDGGHNAHAAQVLADWMHAQPCPVTLILGMMQRKNIHTFLQPMAPCIARIIAVSIEGEACHAPETMVGIAHRMGITADLASSALNDIVFNQGKQDGTLLIAGSLFLAGEILKNHS